MHTGAFLRREHALDEALDLRRRGDPDRVREDELVRSEPLAQRGHVSGVVHPRHERVMIGRLEMISPEQRESLSTLAGMDNISAQMKLAWDSYASMGRFKNALMLALLAEFVYGASNIKFGPEAYCGPPKGDAEVWRGFSALVRR